MKSKKLITTVLITIFLLAGSSVAKANTINYTVQSGDSLWKISQKFNTTVSNITTLNKLNVNNPIYAGQVLVISSNSYNTNTTVSSKVQTTNHKVAVGENLWSIAEKYNTSMDAIKKSNMLASNILMPGQILTIPVNSIGIVSPVGITMMRAKTNNIYGDLYNWENGRRIFTVGQTATVKDLNTGITFKAKYYGGANHADIVTLTKEDTANLKKIFPSWSWNYKRPMVLCFSQGGKYYQLAVSVTGMPHGDTDVYNNGLAGHLDMYFYNSVGHSNPTIDQTHQSNVLKANGQ